jgi:hypothetical protein
MRLWLLGLIIAGAGAAGGVINALLSDNGFALPQYVSATRRGFGSRGSRQHDRRRRRSICHVGPLWALGWRSDRWRRPRINSGQVLRDPRRRNRRLARGDRGRRVLTSAVDKQILKLTATTAASKDAKAQTAATVASAPPTEALRAVMRQ